MVSGVRHLDGTQMQGVPRPEDNTPKDPHYPRMVEVQGKERCYDCSKRTSLAWGPRGAQNVPAPPDPGCPFCKGSGFTRRKVMAQNPEHHTSLVGYEVGRDGQRKFPLPPTLEEVMGKFPGIDRGVAEKIVADQVALARQGVAPYGPAHTPTQNAAAPPPILSERMPEGDPLEDGF